MYKKITIPLLKLNSNCQLKFHVKLFDKESESEENFHTIYYEDYIHMNINSYATLELKDGEWDISKNIFITNRNIYQLIKGVKKLIDNIYKKDTFEIVNGRTVISEESIRENTVDVYLGQSSRVRLQPAVIYDIQEDNFYEGAVIYLNNGQNYVEVHYTMLEALLYNLKKIDFNIYGEMVMRFYLDYIREGEKLETKNVKRKINVFEVETVKEDTKGGLVDRSSSPMDDFF